MALLWSDTNPAKGCLPQLRYEEAAEKCGCLWAEDTLGDSNSGEIMALKDDHRTTLKFLQLVILPLGACFALVFLLRRGFLT